MGSSRDQLRLEARYTARDCKFKRANLEELGERVGMSQRMMADYEQEDAQPPGALLVDLATALEVSTDELLGLSEEPEPVPASTYRLRKRLRKVEELPASDQKTVLKIVDALVEKRSVEVGG